MKKKKKKTEIQLIKSDLFWLKLFLIFGFLLICFLIYNQNQWWKAQMEINRINNEISQEVYGIIEEIVEIIDSENPLPVKVEEETVINYTAQDPL